MDLELGQLELRYEKLRRRNARKDRQLVASLAEKGQLLPVVVVESGVDGAYVLVDGYKRVRALKSLRQDIVRATSWDLAELEAVLLERLMRTSESDGALEQGWLLEELNERFELSHEELARRFDKSQSWVSRRLALVCALPREVQERVQDGLLPAHAAMKFLVPMARAKNSDCARLVSSLAAARYRPSTREVEALYAAWAAGNRQTRELVVSSPMVVLKARVEAKLDQTATSSRQKTAGQALLADLGILVGTSRRACTQLARGAFSQLLPTEEDEARRLLAQARHEYTALFHRAQPLLTASSSAIPDASAAVHPTAFNEGSTQPKESINAQ